MSVSLRCRSPAHDRSVSSAQCGPGSGAKAAVLGSVAAGLAVQLARSRTLGQRSKNGFQPAWQNENWRAAGA